LPGRISGYPDNVPVSPGTVSLGLVTGQVMPPSQGDLGREQKEQGILTLPGDVA